jgi:hypothetical protein
LGFFLRKGFRVTGTAKDHYKQGIDEHMLYKERLGVHVIEVEKQ